MFFEKNRHFHVDNIIDKQTPFAKVKAVNRKNKKYGMVK